MVGLGNGAGQLAALVHLQHRVQQARLHRHEPALYRYALQQSVSLAQTDGSAAGDRRNNRHGLASRHSRVEPVQITHVVVRNKHVYELVQVARVVKQTIGEPGVGHIEVLQHLGKRGAFNNDGGRAARQRAQGGGNANGHGHGRKAICAVGFSRYRTRSATMRALIVTIGSPPPG